jgi:predicted RNA polymerase sigma factor
VLDRWASSRHGAVAGGRRPQRSQAALEIVEAILARGVLRDYMPAHAARAELFRRLGRTAEARASYRRALELCRQDPEHRFPLGRLEALEAAGRLGVIPGRELLDAMGRYNEELM